MSSANRGAVRQRDDYYPTPLWVVDEFLDAFEKDYDIDPDCNVLDPCCGGSTIRGNIVYPPSYPLILDRCGYTNVSTMDIREDAVSDNQCDFIDPNTKIGEYDLIVSNPPYNIATEFIDRARQHATLVAFLLRINFFGSQRRHEWWQSNIPEALYIHSTRPSFVGGKTDSTEYAHFVWSRATKNERTMIKVL